MIRRFLFPLIALLALSPPFLCAQSKVSGTIPSAGGGASCVSINVDAQATVAVQVTGTWTGTLQPEISVQGQAAANTQVTPSTSSTPASTITANGVYRSSVAGGSTFLVCGNTVASGTANIYLNATTAAAGSGLGGGGSGSGTVQSNSGAANAIAKYSAAGGSTTVGPDSALDDGSTTASTLTYGGSGGISAKVINMPGATSGTSTMTPPAVAGTTTNPINFTNVISVPLGSAASGASIQCNNSCTAGIGFYFASNAAPAVSTTNGIFVFDGSTNPSTFRSTGASSPLGTSAAPFGTLFNNGSISKGANIIISGTAPTIAGAGCGGSAASIAANNGTASFTINVGTAPTAGGCTVTLPTAATGWNCYVTDITTNSTSVFLQKQTTSTTTSAVLVNYSDVAVATAPTASDIWRASCFAN